MKKIRWPKIISTVGILSVGILWIPSANAGDMSQTAPLPSPTPSVTSPIISSEGGSLAPAAVPAQGSAPLPVPSPVLSSIPSSEPLIASTPVPLPTDKAAIEIPEPPIPETAMVSQSELENKEKSRRFSLLDFRVAVIGAYQSNSSVYSLMVSWNPQFNLRNGHYIGINLGGTSWSNAQNQSPLVMEYQLVYGMNFHPRAGLELAAGAQTWTVYGGTYPVASGTLFSRFPNAKILDRVFAGYSAYFMNYYFTSEIKLGVGFAF